jgi:hypothetical protein
MAHDISDAFVKQFEKDVHLAYQRQGSTLRNTARTRNGVIGNTTTFQKLGTAEATQKSRHGAVTPMNPDHTSVECTLNDWYAGDWVDRLDEEKIAHDERMILAQTGAWALGRKTDDQIIVELDAAETGITVNKSAFTISTLTAWVAALGARNVPMQDNMVFGLVSWDLWSLFMTFAQFASSDFNGEDLPFKTAMGDARRWAGCVWMPHSGLTGGSGARQCHVFHKSAIGHAIGHDVTTDITWHGDRAAYFVNNYMSMGAKLIDANGVVTRVINEGA